MADLEKWTAEQLDESNLKWLRELPPTRSIRLDDRIDLLCVHGSPRSFDEQITADTPEQDLIEAVDGYDFDIMVCGHTHVQMLRRLESRTIVNVGSVAIPFERAFDGSAPPRIYPWAEYASLELEQGYPTISLHRVEYDYSAYESAVRQSGMSQLIEWLDLWTEGS
jgi:predicted phosphodiesterase